MSQVQLGQGNSGGVKGSTMLEVKDLVVHFTSGSGLFRKTGGSTIKAVDKISFSVGKSEVVAVVGESGSGKTTLGKCLVGLVDATSGTVKVDGTDISQVKKLDSKQYRRDVQMIYQDPFESLTPRMTVYDTLAMPLIQLLEMKDKEQIKARVKELLEETGLDPAEVMYRFPHQLSGGQRQRVNIARALAPNPKLLIADEPITMLDAAQRINILYLLSELRRKHNLTILMITHDLASAKLLCERVLVMYLGKIVEAGQTDVVLKTPTHPYVELILGALPTLTSVNPYNESKLTWIEDTGFNRQGCVFEPRCKYKTEICKTTEPSMEARAAKHLAACHHPLN